MVRPPPLVNSELQMPRHPLDWANVRHSGCQRSLLSLQGESTFAGLPCIFVRLTACNLRCSYCDTAYAFTEGGKKSLPDILTEVRRLAVPFSHPVGGHKLPLIELTGGEPLLQPNVLPLMKALCDDGFTVLIETSGAQDISQIH